MAKSITQQDFDEKLASFKSLEAVRFRNGGYNHGVFVFDFLLWSDPESSSPNDRRGLSAQTEAFDRPESLLWHYEILRQRGAVEIGLAFYPQKVFTQKELAELDIERNDAIWFAFDFFDWLHDLQLQGRFTL